MSVSGFRFMFCSGKVKMYARVHFSMDSSFLWTLVQFQLTMNCNILYWITEMIIFLPIPGFFCFAIVFCYMVTLFSSVWLEARLSNQKLKNRDRTVPSSVSSDVSPWYNDVLLLSNSKREDKDET